MRPLQPVSPGARIALGVSFFVLFVAAWALQKHYTIAGGIGTCALMLERYRDAAKYLAYYVREIEKDTTATPADRSAATRTYAQARAKVGAVKLHVNVERAEVLVGQEVVGISPLEDPVFVEPGTHTISALVQGDEHCTPGTRLDSFKVSIVEIK